MDYKKSKAPVNTITRDLSTLWEQTGNIYESVAIIAKRSNQIAIEIKQDLNKKLSEFASYNESLEEVFENREQIEISRYYEKLPKPTLLATSRSLLKIRFTGAIRRRTAAIKTIFDIISGDVTEKTKFISPSVINMRFGLSLPAYWNNSSENKHGH